jgi:hypothetical protein
MEVTAMKRFLGIGRMGYLTIGVLAGIALVVSCGGSVGNAIAEWAKDILYDNSASGSAATDVQSALDGLFSGMYTDSDAVAAMGAKADTNFLNHDRYTDAAAVAAMGAKNNSNTLNHDRYTDDAARAALTSATLEGTLTTHSFIRTTNTTQYYTISGSAFAPAKMVDGESNEDYATNGGGRYGNTTAGVKFFAPVILPKGVTIDILKACMLYNDDTKTAYVKLRQQSIDSNSLNDLASANFTNEAAVIQCMTVTDSLPVSADTENHAYVVEAYLDAAADPVNTILLVSAQVRYTYNTF